MRVSFALAFVVLLTGCSPSNGTSDGGGTSGDLALPPGTESLRLVESSYTIAPGDEYYQCQHVTMTQDAYLVRITPVSPVGVHHEVLAIDPSATPDGVSRCQAIGTTWTTLFASGINSPSLVMPDKVALKVQKGDHVVLNLHLFNATAAQLGNSAAVDVVVVKDPTGYQLAGVPFVGPINFKIPAAGGSVSGACTASNATRYFAVFPHMHATGTHIKIVAGATTVWDDDYSFTDQRFGFFPTWAAPMAEVPLKAGDKISVTCTYGPDPAGVGIKFGDSTTQEMCFGISYVYPAINTSFGSPLCIQ